MARPAEIECPCKALVRSHVGRLASSAAIESHLFIPCPVFVERAAPVLGLTEELLLKRLKERPTAPVPKPAPKAAKPAPKKPAPKPSANAGATPQEQPLTPDRPIVFLPAPRAPRDNSPSNNSDAQKAFFPFFGGKRRRPNEEGEFCI